MFLSKNLKTIRLKWELQQSGFANLFDVKAHNISQYERGESTPSIFFMIKLQRYTGVNIEELVFGELSPNKLSNKPLLIEKKTKVISSKEEHASDINALVIAVKKLQREIKSLQEKAGITEEDN